MTFQKIKYKKQFVRNRDICPRFLHDACDCCYSHTGINSIWKLRKHVICNVPHQPRNVRSLYNVCFRFVYLLSFTYLPWHMSLRRPQTPSPWRRQIYINRGVATLVSFSSCEPLPRKYHSLQFLRAYNRCRECDTYTARLIKIF